MSWLFSDCLHFLFFLQLFNLIGSFFQLSWIGIGVSSISETNNLTESETRKSSVVKSETVENVNIEKDEELKQQRKLSIAEQVKLSFLKKIKIL